MLKFNLSQIFCFTFIAISVAACAHDDSKSPEAKAAAVQQKCNPSYSTGLLEHEKLSEKYKIKDSSSVRLEIMPGSKIKIDEDIQTCFPPFFPNLFGCRTSHSDSAVISFRKESNGMVLLKDDGSAWAFLSLSADGSAAQMTNFDDLMKASFGRTIFDFKRDKCE